MTMKTLIYLMSIMILSLPVWANYQIYPQVSAQIIKIVKPSQTLKKGEVLVKLDNQIAIAQLDEQLAQLAIKQQLLEDTNLTYTQTQQLFDNLVRSKRELEIAEIAYKQAKYELDIQKAKVKQQQLKLEYYQIKAPFDLIVIQVLHPRNATNHYQPQPLLLVKPSQ